MFNENNQFNAITTHEFLKFISGDCGSGKTTAVLKIISDELEKEADKLFMVVQATKILIDQTAQTMQTVYGITGTAIYSNGLPDDNVMNRVTDFIMNPTSKVLFITDKTFWNLSPSLLKKFVIFVDDVISASDFAMVNDISQYSKNSVKNDIFNELAVFDGNNEYVTSTAKDTKGDIVDAVRKKFSITEQNDFFFMNKSWFNDSEVEQIRIFAYKDLSKYVGLDIIFMSNDFENSLIYLSNKELFKKIEWDLRARNVPYQERLTVKYFSKAKLTKTWKDNNQSKIKTVYNYLNSELNGNEFFWTNNKSDGDTLSLVGDYISPNSRGLNKYQNYNTCVWLACMQPNPGERKCYEYVFGISREQILQAREFETLHQFIMRGCIRKYDSSDIQTVYVFDEEQALSLVSNPVYVDLGLDDDEPKKLGAPVKTVTIPTHITKRKCVFINKCKDEGIEVTHPMFKEWVAKKCEDTPIEVQESLIAKFMKDHAKPG